MLNVTNIIIFFFIHTLTHCVFFLHTLTHYVITRFVRFPEGFFAISCICSSYFISGFGGGGGGGGFENAG